MEEKQKRISTFTVVEKQVFVIRYNQYLQYKCSVILIQCYAMLCLPGQVKSSQVWAQDVRERYMYGNSSGGGDRRKR